MGTPASHYFQDNSKDEPVFVKEQVSQRDGTKIEIFAAKQGYFFLNFKVPYLIHSGNYRTNGGWIAEHLPDEETANSVAISLLYMYELGLDAKENGRQTEAFNTGLIPVATVEEIAAEALQKAEALQNLHHLHSHLSSPLLTKLVTDLVSINGLLGNFKKKEDE